MIPYFLVPTLHLGPIAIHSFGVLAAAGILLASWLIAWNARRRGLEATPLADFAGWAVAGGLIGGHLMHVLLYHPEELRDGGPLQILKIWDGLSSTGGVLGGIAFALWFFHRRRLSFRRYADAIALGLAPGWMVARIGCFTVHDHPGKLTQFFLAVNFPGGARHDLGLDDAILLLFASVLLYALADAPRLRGHLLGVLALVYGVGRFLLDFLRATDVAYADARYFGFTPAQFVCVGFVLYGLNELRLAATSGPAAEPQRASGGAARAP